MANANKPMIIYFVTKADEVVYIGQTADNYLKRWESIIWAAQKGKGSVLGASIRKHGPDSFKIRKAAVFYSQEDMNLATKTLIEAYKPKYNV